MIWLRTLGTLEYVFITCFLLLYIAYIIRIFLISRKMKSDFKRVFYKFVIRSLYFFLLLIALLGPSFGNLKKEVKSISKEIYIVVDISLSMNATDIQPTRLERVKLEMNKIVSAFNSDKIGLIVYGSSAFVQCPPTYDQSAIKLFIETIHSDLLAQGGSDVSNGLQLALDQHLSSKTSHLNKVVILISDGEDFGAKGKKIAEDIRKNNIRLLILGVGSAQGSKIPVYGTFKKDQDGDIVITKLDRERLQELSEEVEGNYFEINEHLDETDFLIQEVNKIEGTVSDVKEIDASANKYFYFLLMALFLIIMDVLITVRTVKI